MRIEKDYAIIETAEEASVFGFTDSHGSVVTVVYKPIGCELERQEILEAITPKEGDWKFFWTGITKDSWSPGYTSENNILPQVKANALTTGKTVGELRALLTWAQGEA